MDTWLAALWIYHIYPYVYTYLCFFHCVWHAFLRGSLLVHTSKTLWQNATIHTWYICIRSTSSSVQGLADALAFLLALDSARMELNGLSIALGICKAILFAKRVLKVWWVPCSLRWRIRCWPCFFQVSWGHAATFAEIVVSLQDVTLGRVWLMACNFHWPAHVLIRHQHLHFFFGSFDFLFELRAYKRLHFPIWGFSFDTLLVYMEDIWLQAGFHHAYFEYVRTQKQTRKPSMLHPSHALTTMFQAWRLRISANVAAPDDSTWKLVAVILISCYLFWVCTRAEANTKTFHASSLACS